MPSNLFSRAMMLRPLAFTFLCIAVGIALSACGGGGEERPAEDTTATAPPADTTDIRSEPLTPAVLKDPRMETLRPEERRILRAYLALVARRQQSAADSLPRGPAAPPESLARWLDSNLTVGEVIALHRGAERIEPQAPRPLPQRARTRTPERVQE